MLIIIILLISSQCLFFVCFINNYLKYRTCEKYEITYIIILKLSYMMNYLDNIK